MNWKCASQICQWIFKRSKIKKIRRPACHCELARQPSVPACQDLATQTVKARRPGAQAGRLPQCDLPDLFQYHLPEILGRRRLMSGRSQKGNVLCNHEDQKFLKYNKHGKPSHTRSGMKTDKLTLNILQGFR